MFHWWGALLPELQTLEVLPRLDVATRWCYACTHRAAWAERPRTTTRSDFARAVMTRDHPAQLAWALDEHGDMDKDEFDEHIHDAIMAGSREVVRARLPANSSKKEDTVLDAYRETAAPGMVEWLWECIEGMSCPADFHEKVEAVFNTRTALAAGVPFNELDPAIDFDAPTIAVHARGHHDLSFIADVLRAHTSYIRSAEVVQWMINQRLLGYEGANDLIGVALRRNDLAIYRLARTRVSNHIHTPSCIAAALRYGHLAMATALYESEPTDIRPDLLRDICAALRVPSYVSFHTDWVGVVRWLHAKGAKPGNFRTQVALDMRLIPSPDQLVDDIEERAEVHTRPAVMRTVWETLRQPCDRWCIRVLYTRPETPPDVLDGITRAFPKEFPRLGFRKRLQWQCANHQ